MKYELPPLPYAYNALEPYIDAQTMEIHHTKHHQAYINKLNEALALHPEISEIPLEELLKNPSRISEDIYSAVINHGGGTYNHTIFWNSMSPQLNQMPTGALMQSIEKDFGTVDSFWEQFTAMATKHFGSGWVWLTVSEGGEKKLKITTTKNQDSPLTLKETPLLGIDVWEHAYYLKYQNKRTDYITAWKNVANWEYAKVTYDNL